MATKTKIAKPKIHNQNELYSVTVSMGTDVKEFSAPTIYEALEKVKMDKVTGKISLNFKHQNKVATLNYVRPIFFKKVLYSNEHKLLLEKRAKLLLNELTI